MLEFFKDRDVLFVQILTARGVIDLPAASSMQRTLIDYEGLLARVLHDRYALPDTDHLTATVWARASIGAIRTALGVLACNRTPEGLPRGALANAIRVCFATLPGTRPPASHSGITISEISLIRKGP